MYHMGADHGSTSVLDHSKGALGTHRASAGLSRRERGVSNETRGIVRRPQAANMGLDDPALACPKSPTTDKGVRASREGTLAHVRTTTGGTEVVRRERRFTRPQNG